MPINEALFAAMKAASYIKPNAGKSYKLQRVAEELIAKQAPDNPKCRVEDAFAPMADGYAVPLRVFTPLVAYGAPLPEALEESSANGTPVASAISAILPAVLPKVLPKILIKESTSSGNADGISGNANTELPSVTPRGTVPVFPRWRLDHRRHQPVHAGLRAYGRTSATPCDLSRVPAGS